MSSWRPGGRGATGREPGGCIADRPSGKHSTHYYGQRDEKSHPFSFHQLRTPNGNLPPTGRSFGTPPWKSPPTGCMAPDTLPGLALFPPPALPFGSAGGRKTIRKNSQNGCHLTHIYIHTPIRLLHCIYHHNNNMQIKSN